MSELAGMNKQRGEREEKALDISRDINKAAIYMRRSDLAAGHRFSFYRVSASISATDPCEYKLC